MSSILMQAFSVATSSALNLLVSHCLSVILFVALCSCCVAVCCFPFPSVLCVCLSVCFSLFVSRCVFPSVSLCCSVSLFLFISLCFSVFVCLSAEKKVRNVIIASCSQTPHQTVPSAQISQPWEIFVWYEVMGTDAVHINVLSNHQGVIGK